MRKAVIIINASCHQGKGWKRWLSIRQEVLRRLPTDCKEVILEHGATLSDLLSPHLQQDERGPDPRPPGKGVLIVSAGGDGTVHYLVNHLLAEGKEYAGHVILGAIGLGSSNDFLKPFHEKIKGVPVRINYTNGTMQHDIGMATYLDDANVEHRRFFIVNASVGVTAQANWNFNNPDFLLRLLKKHATGGAILYTAVSTILGHRNQNLSLRFNERMINTSVSNINILKVPFVSGSFFYRQPVLRDDGKLALNICINMSKRELLSVLSHLQKGNFEPGKHKITQFTTGVDITADNAFVFECDGETAKTRSLHITLLPNAITILKN
ncbi:diacylglycerol/lipid kinase family protein [Flavitalea antarctica]